MTYRLLVALDIDRDAASATAAATTRGGHASSGGNHGLLCDIHNQRGAGDVDRAPCSTTDGLQEDIVESVAAVGADLAIQGQGAVDVQLDASTSAGGAVTQLQQSEKSGA